jgi:hypothetical protein
MLNKKSIFSELSESILVKYQKIIECQDEFFCQIDHGFSVNKSWMHFFLRLKTLV